jgi:predicted AAA+ superfamily ATPase
MFERNLYIEQIEKYCDINLIKIITGIRRCGKSTILLLLRERFIAKGILPEQIIYINFESFKYSELKTAPNLYKFISEQIKSDQRYYILLDEIQEVVEWEKCINSISVDYNVDIYLTGSNSHILSSELATYIAGRYVEIPIFTLSYKEILDFKVLKQNDIGTDKVTLFNQYLRQGGFPIIHTNDFSDDTIYKIVYDIYSSIILRDTIQRYKIRDVELLERVIKYVLDNIGKTFSGKNIADYFKSQQRKIDINTIYNYMYALEGAFIFYRVPRYDIKGKEILKTQEKFYLSDISLLYAAVGYKDRLISGILENIVFLELKRRGYKVYIGKLDNNEVDFIAEKLNHRIYIQVTYKLESQKTVEREFSVLMNIKDNYPKYVVTMDEFWREQIEGIKHFYISDFLLTNEY